MIERAHVSFIRLPWVVASVYLQSNIKPSKRTGTVWVSSSILFFVTCVDSCAITATEV